MTDDTPSPFSTDAIAHLYPFEEIEGWRLLLRHVDITEGSFSFLLILAPDDWAIALLREHLSRTLSPPPDAVARVRFDPAEPPENLAVSLLALAPSPGLRVVWIDADPAEPDKLDERDQQWNQALVILNRYRNALQQRFRCTIALAVPSRIEPVLRAAAPDLWSIRSSVLRIEPPGASRPAIDRLPINERQILDDADLGISGDPAETLAQAEKLRGKPGRELLLATLLQRAGNQARRRLDWTTAEQALTEAYSLQEAAGGDPELRWDIATDLAEVFRDMAKFDRAEHYLTLARQIANEHFGPIDPRTATTLNNLAQLLKATNRLSEAEPLMRRALEIGEQVYGPNHPTVATRLNNLAQLLHDTNRLSEAEPLIRRALTIDEQVYGPNHPTVAIRLNNLAVLLQATNRLSEAEPLIRRALEIGEQVYGPNHPTVALRLNNLAQLLQDTNRLSEAEPLMHRALAIDEQVYGPNHPTVALRLNNLAQLLQATNRLSEVEPLMRRVVEILVAFQRQTGYEHPQYQSVITQYSDWLRAMGRSPSDVASVLKELTGSGTKPKSRKKR